jgi:hypothetical protein
VQDFKAREAAMVREQCESKQEFTDIVAIAVNLRLA